MRFNIELQRNSKQKMLPIDYQYYIGAWIYKVIKNCDSEFSSFLHKQGYTSGNKKFKFFCYSPLKIKQSIFHKEKSLLEIRNNSLSVQVSFYLPDIAERFILGLFKQQKVYIGDQYNGIDCIVNSIERLPSPPLNKTMNYTAKSPIVVSIMPHDEKYAKYLSPEDENYSELLKNNLLQKSEAVKTNLKLPIDFSFRLIPESKIKSKLITIKAYTPQESKIRGFVYNFTLTAPPEIHDLIINAGLGEKNSTGFGWCEASPPIS